MLDLRLMILLRHGRGPGVGSYGSDRRRSIPSIQMVNRFGVLLLVLSLSSLILAQQPQSGFPSQGGFPSTYPYPGIGQQDSNTNTWDCSDPLLGTSPECSGQGLGDLNPNASFGSMSRMSPLTSYGPQQRGTVPSFS